MAELITDVLARNVRENSGAEGERWLTDLPRLITEVADHWDLRLGDPFLLSFNWVAPATRPDGGPAVLKLGVPGKDLRAEAEALRIFDGYGAARLLDEDPERGALLIERARPGTMARDLVPADDEAATAAIITVGRRLHRPAPVGCRLPEVPALGVAFREHLRRGDDSLPRRLVEKASALFDELCASATEHLVLHGDLHHDNVLRAEREPWLAIDPHGYVGDPGFECAAMLYNPEPDDRDPALLALAPGRIEQLADGYGIPVDRVRAWGFAYAMLSEVWTAQGGTPGSRALDVAEMLEP